MVMRVLELLLLLSSVFAFHGPVRGRVGMHRSLTMSESTAQRPSSTKAYRIFNAASLPELLNPISEEEARSLDKVQDVLKKAGKYLSRPSPTRRAHNLPWISKGRI